MGDVFVSIDGGGAIISDGARIVGGEGNVETRGGGIGEGDGDGDGGGADSFLTTSIGETVGSGSAMKALIHINRWQI